MTHRSLFMFGLLLILGGQVLLAQGNDFVYSQRPIDYAHWLLLLGAVILVPQVLSFPRSVPSHIGKTLTLIGIACTVGMCVIDFIFWSFDTDAQRDEFAGHLSQTPSVWLPFMTIGPSSKVFNLGLLILSLNYYRERMAGVIVIVLATLVLWRFVEVPFRLVVGYSLTLLGFVLLFREDGDFLSRYFSKKSS